jgi:hypothetical protein
MCPVDCGQAFAAQSGSYSVNPRPDLSFELLESQLNFTPPRFTGAQQLVALWSNSVIQEQRLQIFHEPVRASDREPTRRQLDPARNQVSKKTSKPFVFKWDILVVTQENPIFDQGMF